MFNKFLFCALLAFPNLAFPICVANPLLSDYVMNEANILVSFTVTGSQISTVVPDSYIDISITEEFNSNIIDDPRIRINTESILGPSLSEFTENIEWLSVLTKTEESGYFFAGCAPKLQIESGVVIGNTGLKVLDDSDEDITVEKFMLALNAYQQGISSADTVCQSDNSYCSGARATYDASTEVLNLPTVAVSAFPTLFYTNAKMQKTGDSPVTFRVIELDN